MLKIVSQNYWYTIILDWKYILKIPFLISGGERESIYIFMCIYTYFWIEVVPQATIKYEINTLLMKTSLHVSLRWLNRPLIRPFLLGARFLSCCEFVNPAAGLSWGGGGKGEEQEGRGGWLSCMVTSKSWHPKMLLVEVNGGYNSLGPHVI